MLQFPTVRKEQGGIIKSLISGFIDLAYDAISSFLHNRRHRTLHKEVKIMETKVNIQCNRLIHLEDFVVMYDVNNVETLENLINIVQHMYNTTTLNKNYSQVNFIQPLLGM